MNGCRVLTTHHDHHVQYNVGETELVHQALIFASHPHPQISLFQGMYSCFRPEEPFFPKALRRVLPENPLNTYTSTLTLTHTHWKSESIQVRSMPVSKYASVSMQA